MSEFVEITVRNFKREVLNSKLPVLIDFYAEWCMPCRSMSQFLHRTAPRYDGQVKFAKINIDREPKLASIYRVSSIPTLVLLKNGNVARVIVGLIPLDKLDKLLGQAIRARAPS